MEAPVLDGDSAATPTSPGDYLGEHGLAEGDDLHRFELRVVKALCPVEEEACTSLSAVP